MNVTRIPASKTTQASSSTPGSGLCMNCRQRQGVNFFHRFKYRTCDECQNEVDKQIAAYLHLRFGHRVGEPKVRILET